MTEAKSDAASCKKYHQDHKTTHWASLLKKLRPQRPAVMIGQSAKSGDLHSQPLLLCWTGGHGTEP